MLGLRMCQKFGARIFGHGSGNVTTKSCSPSELHRSLVKQKATDDLHLLLLEFASEPR